MPKYKVREGENIVHDNVQYGPGDMLICTEAQAKMLRVDPVDTKQSPPPVEKSLDGNIDTASAKIIAMTDAKEIRAYIKGDDRKGVIDAAAARIEAIKETK